MLRSQSDHVGDLHRAQQQELRDVVVEAINAADPDLLALVDEVIIGIDTLEIVEELIEVPGVILTRGYRDRTPVAAVWERGRDQRYARVGHLEFEIRESRPRIVLVTTPCPDVNCEIPIGAETTIPGLHGVSATRSRSSDPAFALHTHAIACVCSARITTCPA